jgi:hypothetical protein
MGAGAARRPPVALVDREGAGVLVDLLQLFGVGIDVPPLLAAAHVVDLEYVLARIAVLERDVVQDAGQQLFPSRSALLEIELELPGSVADAIHEDGSHACCCEPPGQSESEWRHDAFVTGPSVLIDGQRFVSEPEGGDLLARLERAPPGMRVETHKDLDGLHVRFLLKLL